MTDHISENSNSYDFIIIGGGASGCALARALAKRGTTLLLERGKSMEEEPLTQTESGWPAVLAGSAVDRQQVKGGGWAFTGNVLGGGTSINAGVFLKEQDGPFFNEHSHLMKGEASQSYENISKVSFERKLSPVSRTIIEAMMGAGIGEFHNSTDIPVKGIFSPYSIFDSSGDRSCNSQPGTADPALLCRLLA
jgi:choline dehydrogenase-like flavoprotein